MDFFSDAKQLTNINLHARIHSVCQVKKKKKIVKFRLRLNKAVTVVSHQTLIRHNPVLGGRGKPLFFCYFHL